MRLPKPVAFPDGVTEVEITTIGDAWLITPVSGTIDFWWDHEIRAMLAAAGTPIGGYDVLIAGHARSAALAIVTKHRGEFARVPGLEVVDWTV